MHTEGKLTVHKEKRISDESGISVATLALSPKPDEISKANARRLVACWNEHDDLVSTLREMRGAWGKTMSFSAMDTMFSKVDAILAKYPEQS